MHCRRMAGLHIHLSESVLISAGVVDPQSGKKSNPFPRLALTQKHIGEYMVQIIPFWLRYRVFFPLNKMLESTKTLAMQARWIEKAAVDVLQQAISNHKVLTGAITVADIMMSAFKHAHDRLEPFFTRAVDNNTSTASPAPTLSWGMQIHPFLTWANSVNSGSCAAGETATESSEGNSSTDAAVDAVVEAPASVSLLHQSPSLQSGRAPSAGASKERFYAVAVGRCPGVYCTMDDVRSQTLGLKDAHGKMKICSSLAEAEDYVEKRRRIIVDSPHKSPQVPPSPSGKKFYAAVDTSRPGIYDHQHVAESYVLGDVDMVVGVSSLDEAREILHHPAPARYTESTANPARAESVRIVTLVIFRSVGRWQSRRLRSDIRRTQSGDIRRWAL